MFKFIQKFKKKNNDPVEIEKPDKPRQIDFMFDNLNLKEEIEQKFNEVFKNSVHNSIAMDANKKYESFAMDNQLPVKQAYNNQTLPEAQVLWYANQSFIGYQLCSLLAQQWLISKCCLMPAKDATRNGYEITINDGTEVEPEILDYIREADVRFNINKNLIQFVQMGRVFGIRHAMFIVESDDPDYYLKPFNPDGVTPGSYKGISQIDPYWITPQLDAEAAGNPASIYFYEPTWWVINGKPIHRTHLVIFRTEEVSDILKPSYIFGGVPIPQKVAQRVFAAESTANEAPMLAATKRTDVMKIDVTQAAAQPAAIASRLQQYVTNRNNYGVKTIGLDDEYEQHDTSLADLDAVIMTQYQIVAAAANVPATKLLGTQPKGFNTTGEFEESSYHEELESVQRHDLTALLERHHLLLIRSEIAPQFNIEPFHTTITWNPLDAMTAEELAVLNKIKSETGQYLITSGAISPEDERQRIITDPQSGYNGIVDESNEDMDINMVKNDLGGSIYD
jgi:phage-related protein (TIGR01555 family)